MKPNPFASLNHFTVPCSMFFPLIRFTLKMSRRILQGRGLVIRRELLTTNSILTYFDDSTEVPREFSKLRSMQADPGPNVNAIANCVEFQCGNQYSANSYFPGDTVPISRAFVDAAYLHCEVPACVLDWFLQLPRKSLTVFFFAE